MSESSVSPHKKKPCVYCQGTDHTGPEHLHFVLALQPASRRVRVERAIERAKTRRRRHG